MESFKIFAMNRCSSVAKSKENELSLQKNISLKTGFLISKLNLRSWLASNRMKASNQARSKSNKLNKQNQACSLDPISFKLNSKKGNNFKGVLNFSLNRDINNISTRLNSFDSNDGKIKYQSSTTSNNKERSLSVAKSQFSLMQNNRYKLKCIGDYNDQSSSKLHQSRSKLKFRFKDLQNNKRNILEFIKHLKTKESNAQANAMRKSISSRELMIIDTYCPTSINGRNSSNRTSPSKIYSTYGHKIGKAKSLSKLKDMKMKEIRNNDDINYMNDIKPKVQMRR